MSSKQALIEALQRENELQKKLIETQQEVIHLYQKLEQLQPKSPESDGRWHQVSGLISSEVVEKGNLEQLNQLDQWLHQFAKKYIKPYVHHDVYTEIMAHLTRGIPAQKAKLSVLQDLGISEENLVTPIEQVQSRQ